MINMENLPSGIRRSRRNLIKIGAITASAIFASLATATSASAASPTPTPVARPSCFLKGTRIRTADGDKKIEDLAVGDMLPGFFGGTRPIQWVGRYSFKKSDPTKTWVSDILPVRIARSALGPDVPHADLCITRGHALLIDGVLVPICHLINGTTITTLDASDLNELEYFHIKLEHHDVIYAEGAPCETLLNVDESAVNFAEYLRQYGSSEITDARCAAWLGFGRRIEIKSRFRGAISPWIDCRERFDVIRDELEEGGVVVPQHSELA
jgi:hypothetical protein